MTNITDSHPGNSSEDDKGRPRQMHLVHYNIIGPNGVTWRHRDESNAYFDPAYWEERARLLETAKFDAMFFADSHVFHDDAAIRTGGELYMIDPAAMAMCVARATKHLGIGITVSTSYSGPFGIARSLGSLDVLSGGRMAWNVVTSPTPKAAASYGMAGILGHTERYDRADEVVEASMGLWDSFPTDAFVVAKEEGQYMDPTKLKSYEFSGQHISTRGPLTVPQSAQGRPVIVQAGASERGKQCAARWAEVIFSTGGTVAKLQDYYTDMKARTKALGRNPDDCVILPGLTVTVAETEELASARAAYEDSLMIDEIAVSVGSKHTGIDFSTYPMDGPFPEIDDIPVSHGLYNTMLQRSRSGGLSLIETLRSYVSGGTSLQAQGSPEQVADRMQELFEQNAGDGFMITCTGGFEGLNDFVRLVIPILQERGLFRTEYPGATLRDTLGLTAAPFDALTG